MKIPQPLQNAWANVRDDTSTANWIVVEPDSTGSEAVLVAKGKSGWDEFCANFKDDTILFGGCRCRAVDDRGTTKSVRAKFIMVSWMGSKVGAVKRARAGTLQGEFKRLFVGHHVSLQASDKDDLDVKALEKQLQSSTGAHKPTGYEFEGNEAVEGLVDKDDGAAVASSGAASVGTARAVSPAKTFQGDTQGSPKEVWAAIRADSSPLHWVMLGYDGRDLATAHVRAKGYGGLEEFKAALADDQVLFGGLKCKAIDDRGTVKSVRAKFIFVSWTGPKVKPMMRAQVSTHKSHFERILDGSHISVQASDASDLTPKELERTLQSSTGAHKPTGYDFTGASEEEAAAAKAAAPPAAAAAAPPAAAAAAAAPEKPAEEKKEEKPAEEKKEEKPAEEEKKEAPPPPAPAAPAPPPPPGAKKAPPPPPPPPPKEYMDKLAAQMSAPKPGGKGALFADLAKGTDITKGLRKVERSEMRHKNRDQDEVGKATDFSELEAKKAARQAELEAKRGGGQKKKGEPKHELEGKNWKIENQDGTRMEDKHIVMEEGDVDKSHALHISDCENFLLEVKGKVNSIVITNCKNTGVMFQDVVAAVEVMNGKKINMQASGALASVVIEKSTEVNLYTTEASRGVEVRTVASTALNVTFPDEKGGDADPIEMPLPEQYSTRIVPKEGGGVQLVTVPTSHAD